MSKSFGTMMSGDDALKFLDQVESTIDFRKQNKQFSELFYRMKNRFAYHIAQASPVKPKFHKGIYSSKNNYWTCGNCGCVLRDGVTDNFCWNCGYKIEWENPRCLTGYHD